MAMDYLREALACFEPVAADEVRAHFVGDLRIDGGAFLANGGRDFCNGHHLEAGFCSVETRTGGPTFTRSRSPRPPSMIPRLV